MDQKAFPDKMNLDRTGIDYRPEGVDAYCGSMFLGPEVNVSTVQDRQGEVVYRCSLDLSKCYLFVPRINTRYEVSVGYCVGYKGCEGVWANSRPVTLEVRMPENEILNYYLSELTADRARERSRQAGDFAIRYPVDELLKIGEPALRELEERCQAATDRETIRRLVMPIRLFDKGIEVLRRLSQNAKGDVKAEVDRELNWIKVTGWTKEEWLELRPYAREWGNTKHAQPTGAPGKE